MGFDLGLRKECNFSRQGSEKESLVKAVICTGAEVRQRYALVIVRRWESLRMWRALRVSQSSRYCSRKWGPWWYGGWRMTERAVVRACWSGAERMAEKQTGYRMSVALSQLGQGMEREETNQWGSHENSVNE